MTSSGIRPVAILRKAIGRKAAKRRTETMSAAFWYSAPRRRQVGSGVAMRNVYPGYFSKMVMAHEMGHYFGLCHINHNGVQNIMFSNAAHNSIWDWGLFGYYLNAEPYFTSRDKRNVWRFIVDQLRNEL
jgi:hypothetical protein